MNVVAQKWERVGPGWYWSLRHGGVVKEQGAWYRWPLDGEISDCEGPYRTAVAAKKDAIARTELEDQRKNLLLSGVPVAK